MKRPAGGSSVLPAVWWPPPTTRDPTQSKLLIALQGPLSILPSHRRCVYRISTTPGSVIQVNFRFES